MCSLFSVLLPFLALRTRGSPLCPALIRRAGETKAVLSRALTGISETQPELCLLSPVSPGNRPSRSCVGAGCTLSHHDGPAGGHPSQLATEGLWLPIEER